MVSVALALGCSESTLRYEKAPPEATIVSPANGAQVREGASLELLGSVSDAETEPEALVVRWFAEADVVCEGVAPDTTGLVRCATRVFARTTYTLEVRDGDGGTATATVTVEVDDAQPPTAVIAAPPDGSTVSGVAVELAGLVDDDLDPAPTLRVWWASDVDGVLAEPTAGPEGLVSANVALSGGPHVLTLWVEDTLGQQASDTIGVVSGVEVCNGIDDDGDDLVDEDLSDTDADTVCDELDRCEGHDDHLDLDLDGVPDGCDGCVAVAETCNTIDDDCDGEIDEGLPCGCADGTREGFVDPAAFPDVAACDGAWTGALSGGSVLCEPGWHVCAPPTDATDAAILAVVTYADATAFGGCYAYDAALDFFSCIECTGTDDHGDGAAVGADCPYHWPSEGNACLANGVIVQGCCHVDGCSFMEGVTSGAVCCRAP
jgi:hypothetical protein